ncbi:MAG: hypothetical protein A2122_03005 [Candidatus Liptonbacteria bacterium GWB1_49_6]|uniref:Uncharacterized protein n=1 Tax=Candidatus Liptonbacteria bacterium GWB1_49_6 TaxID=1798644 RepID=A0A1G2C6P1_9BACT|nr:MAG: hypothetical protein A2122_03005 [Candidatus Liptonbacteria bacterium GWB1_49_6]
MVKKLNREVADLREDIAQIRETLSRFLRDPEGEYRPEFVRKMLQRAKGKPTYRFTNRMAFLAHLHGRKR